MKKILFVINTFSRAGAETALLELLRLLAAEEQYELSLYVLMEQGEMLPLLPEGVKLENHRFHTESVLGGRGRKIMYRTILRALLHRGNFIRLFPYLAGAFAGMLRRRRIQPDKLFWRVLSDGAQRLPEEYDLAIAFLEGGSAYYVADHVRAKRKAAFIHIDYGRSGYTRRLDKDCYLKYDAVFPVGENVKQRFLEVYPECAERTKIFPNVINQTEIRRKAKLPGGFDDGFEGICILTVGRLTRQKSYPVAVEAMRLLKTAGEKVRWYVLGEGPERVRLERQIAASGLQEDFLLMGETDNPYPYYAQTDIYVHATGYEGKSIAVQEAQTLGCAIVVSESSREQVRDGVDGTVCALEPEAVCGAIRELIREPQKRAAYGHAAEARRIDCEEQKKLLEELLWK